MASITIEKISDITPAPFNYLGSGLYACASAGTTMNNNRYLKLSISDAPESYCLQFAISAAQRDSNNKNYFIYLKDDNTSSWLDIAGKQHSGTSYDLITDYSFNGGSSQTVTASSAIAEDSNYRFTNDIIIRLFVAPNKIQVKYKSGDSWTSLSSYQWSSFNLSFDLSNILLGANLSVIYNLNLLKLYNYEATEELATCQIPDIPDFSTNCPKEPAVVKDWAFTKTGNPTISTNGEVTGFQKKYTTGAQDGSYLQLNTSLFKSTKQSVIVYGCFRANSLTGKQIILKDSSIYGFNSSRIAVYLADNNLQVLLGTKRVPQTLSYKNIEVNKKYFFAVVVQASSLLLYVGESYNSLSFVDCDCSYPTYTNVNKIFKAENTLIGYSGYSAAYTETVFDGMIQAGVLEIQEDDTVTRIATDYEDPVDTSGTITVNKGYYNADGTNIIKFTSPVTKTLTEAKANLGGENQVILTLDDNDTSSFILNGTYLSVPTGYKITKKIETTKIYTDPTNTYILGTEPTGIDYTVTSQKPGGAYELQYLTLTGSVNYDETTGKLSGFSESKYATSSSGITFGSSFDLIYNVTVASASTQQTLFYGQRDYGMLFTSGKIAFWPSQSGVTSVVDGNTYWIRLVWNGTLYTAYSLLDDGTYTLNTLPELSSWTQEFTYSSSSNIFSSGYWVGYHSQASGQYARSTFNMGKAQITTNGVTYRYADGDTELGGVSFTKGFVYDPDVVFQLKKNEYVPLDTLKSNNVSTATIGYKNELLLRYQNGSDVSFPIITTDSRSRIYNFKQDIYIDNTKTKLLGTTSVSDSWSDDENYTVVGSPTIQDYILSNITTSSYIYSKDNIVCQNKPFEMAVAFTTGSDISGRTTIIGQHTTNLTTPQLALLDTGVLEFITPLSSSSWGPLLQSGAITANTKYKAKYVWDGTTAYFYLATGTGAYELVASGAQATCICTQQIEIGTDIHSGAFKGSIDLSSIYVKVNNKIVWTPYKTPYIITPGTSATDTGSITFKAGYIYVDETNGSFFIANETTKTLEELVVGTKQEQMGLYLVIKEDQSTDFVLSSSAPTEGITYSEKFVDVYLDRTLSYIYGTTTDTRKQFTVNATPDTASIHLVDLDGETEVTGTGIATILVPEGHQVSWDVSLDRYVSQSGEETLNADVTKEITLQLDTSTSLSVVGEGVTIADGIATGFSTTSYLEGTFE